MHNSSNSKKPKLLLMGLRRSGKSSIQQVVFNKMSPNETLFLESSGTGDKLEHIEQISSIVDFQVCDFPGQVDLFDQSQDSAALFQGVGALVFVIDAQDDYIESLSKLFLAVTRAFKVNPGISFEVFIHKVDGLSEDHKIETQRDIQQRMTDELLDAGLEQIYLSFYLTSIYDHSIFEAFSKVIQKLMPRLPALENLLNILCSNCGIEKAFLFDISSKIYIATDSSPVDMQSYELCSDMIDVVVDMSLIYNINTSHIRHAPTIRDSNSIMSSSPEAAAAKYTPSNSRQPPQPVSATGNGGTGKASSIMQLNNGTVIILDHVKSSFALVCFLRSENFAEKRAWMEVNFQKFRESIGKILEL
eukprot:Partr_v1_DN27194_c2_g1_i2_m15892 putative ras-related GTP binding